MDIQVNNNVRPSFGQLILKIDETFQEKLRDIKVSTPVAARRRRLAVLDILFLRLAHLEHATRDVEKRHVTEKGFADLTKQANELLEELAVV